MSKQPKLNKKVGDALRRPISIYPTTLECDATTPGAGDDEPFLLIVAVDRTSALPTLEVFRYGPWAGLEEGDTAQTAVVPPNTPDHLATIMRRTLVLRKPFWPVNGAASAVMSSPDDAIFIVILMESDTNVVDGPEKMRLSAKVAALASLVASAALDRATQTARLIADLKAALPPVDLGFLTEDRVDIEEIVFSRGDLNHVQRGEKGGSKVRLRGDGASYLAAFEVMAA